MKITIEHERRERGEFVVVVLQDGHVAGYLHRRKKY